MALNNLGLGFLFTARDLASGVMTRVRSQFNQTASDTQKSSAAMNAAFGATAVGIAGMSVGAVALGGAFAAANQYGKFEQGLAAVGAVTKATTDELELLREAAVQAGIDTQFSPDEATEGLLSLASAGQTAQQATKTLLPVLDLAAGSLGQLGVAQSAEAVVGTLNAYGFAADRAGNVTDRLLRITQLTNFQTRDFETGLAKAAAAGSTFNQGLDDVLITMGLLRNRNIDASSSATAFRESVRRLGSDQRAQAAVTEQGVEIFDKNTGKMRSMIDITNDLIKATAGMSDEERNRVIVNGFGARGLLAFNAIQKAAFTTTVNGKKVTLEGAAAIDAMREAMGEASGTAASFREKMLDTFEGQKTLLAGTLQTLGIVSGEAFAKTFKPLVGFVTDSFNKLIVLVKATPLPVKRLFGGMVLLFGAITLVGGAIALAGGAIYMLTPALGVMIGLTKVVAMTLLPVIGLVGLVAFAVNGFRIALEELPGAFGASSSLLDDMRLGFDALKQLFSQGGFSGAVREELGKRSNQGLRNFAISVFTFVSRIQHFFSSIGTGFRAAIREMGPAFEALSGAFHELGFALGFLGTKADAGEARSKWDAMGSAGATLGRVLSGVFKGIVIGLTFLTNIVTWAVFKWEALTVFWGELKAAVDDAMPVLRVVGTLVGIALVGHFATLFFAMLPTTAQLAAMGIEAGITALAFLFVAGSSMTFAGALTAVKAAATPLLFGFLKLFAVLAIGWGIIRGVADAMSDNVDAVGLWENIWKHAAVAILGFLKGIAEAVNIVAKGLGIDFFSTAAADIEEFKEMVGLTKEGTAIKVVDGEKAATDAAFLAANARAAPGLAEAFSLAPGAEVPGAAIAQTEALRGGLGGDGSRELMAAAEQLRKAKEAPTNIRAVFQLDEATLGEVFASVNRGESVTGFSPSGVPVE